MHSVGVASSALDSRTSEMLGLACSRPSSMDLENCCRHSVRRMSAPPFRNWMCSMAFAIVTRPVTATSATSVLFSIVDRRYGCANDRVTSSDCCAGCGIDRNFGCDCVEHFWHFCRAYDPVNVENCRENIRHDFENCIKLKNKKKNVEKSTYVKSICCFVRQTHTYIAHNLPSTTSTVWTVAARSTPGSSSAGGSLSRPRLRSAPIRP